jgi:hypothetical protein
VLLLAGEWFCIAHDPQPDVLVHQTLAVLLAQPQHFSRHFSSARLRCEI